MDASPNFINHLTNYERAAAARVAATAIADGTDVVATLPVKLPKRRVIATWVEGRLEVAGWDRELGQHVLLRRITPLPYAIAATVPQLLLLEWQFALNVAFTYPAGCFDLTAVDRNSAVIAAIYEAFDEGWQHAYIRPGTPLEPPSVVVVDETRRVVDFVRNPANSAERALSTVAASILTDDTVRHLVSTTRDGRRVICLGPAPSITIRRKDIDAMCRLRLLKRAAELLRLTIAAVR